MKNQRTMGIKIGILAALLCFGIAAQQPASRPPVSSAAEAAKYRAFADKYCVTCHNKRAALPAGDPVNLEPAAFDDLLGHAGAFERVLRKLSVRAMPPPGLPRPSEAEYVGFTNWLAASLEPRCARGLGRTAG